MVFVGKTWKRCGGCVARCVSRFPCRLEIRILAELSAAAKLRNGALTVPRARNHKQRKPQHRWSVHLPLLFSSHSARPAGWGSAQGSLTSPFSPVGGTCQTTPEILTEPGHPTFPSAPRVLLLELISATETHILESTSFPARFLELRLPAVSGGVKQEGGAHRFCTAQRRPQTLPNLVTVDDTHGTTYPP